MKKLIIVGAIQIALLVGYVMNVVKFFQCDFEPSYKAEIIHGVGIITGLGAITGYMSFGE